jgi:transcriptional regulator with XRE-family HTH domain
MSTILEKLGEELQRERRARGLSQADLASRLGRDRARVSEFERYLAENRPIRDRLTLFGEICDALGLVPLVVPRARASEIRALIEDREAKVAPRSPHPSAFDDLFVDLGDADDDQR